MESSPKFEAIQPRILRYRSHYKVYFIAMMSVAFIMFCSWVYMFHKFGWTSVWSHHSLEVCWSLFYYCCCPVAYYFWLAPRLNHSVQVFPDRIFIRKGKHHDEVFYPQIESITIVGWSLFYVKIYDGHKYYFNADLERVDYIWEGIAKSRPELMSGKDHEEFRLHLVKADHHLKRREWFFRNKIVDVVNWIVMPVAFVSFAWFFQSHDIQIHHYFLYFFRLTMYAFLVLLTTSSFYSLILKKFVFDPKFDENAESAKIRDLEFEGFVIQRSKIFQFVTASLILTLIVKADLNFYSLAKTKGDLSHFNLKSNRTILIDNRYNCFDCRYGLVEGDIVMFDKGHIGEVFAKAGDAIGEVTEDKSGRMVASVNEQIVPKDHVAVKTANGKDLVFIKVVDLIGKVKK